MWACRIVTQAQPPAAAGVSPDVLPPFPEVSFPGVSAVPAHGDRDGVVVTGADGQRARVVGEDDTRGPQLVDQARRGRGGPPPCSPLPSRPPSAPGSSRRPPSTGTGDDTHPRPLAAHPLPAPVLWGVVWGLIQAASPLGFWWPDPAVVYALSLALIAAVYIGFAVADGRLRFVAVEASIAGLFVVLGSPATGSRTSGSTTTMSPTHAGGHRSISSWTG